MFKLMEQANEMKDKMRILHFEIGDPSFPTPDNVVDQTINALRDGKTHYSNSRGEPECIRAVAEYMQKQYGFYPDERQIVICTANAAIDFVCKCVADPGDEILCPDPGFSTYFSAIAYSGLTPVSVPMVWENRYVMTAAEIRERITDRTRLIILNSPHNPTGSLMREDEVRQVYELARERNIFILSDEVYARIIYDGDFISPSLWDHCKENVIVLGSLSKTYAMTGWRLGYVVCPEHLAEKLALTVQTVLSCMPSFTQYGMVEALRGDQSIIKSRVQILRERRDRLLDGLNSIQGLSCLVPQGAFYAFPRIGLEEMNGDDQEYCRRLLVEQGICAVPGSFFGEWGKGHFRLCYASSSLEEINEALERIQAFHERML